MVYFCIHQTNQILKPMLSIFIRTYNQESLADFALKDTTGIKLLLTFIRQKTSKKFIIVRYSQQNFVIFIKLLLVRLK